jgi:hypothetical protein
LANTSALSELANAAYHSLGVLQQVLVTNAVDPVRELSHEFQPHLLFALPEAGVVERVVLAHVRVPEREDDVARVPDEVDDPQVVVAVERLVEVVPLSGILREPHRRVRDIRVLLVEGGLDGEERLVR